MKLRRGKPRYKLPPHSKILSVRIEGNQKHNQMAAYILQPTLSSELGQLRQVLAMPTFYAVHDDIIEFAPPPDKPYVAKVTYAPPLMEF